MEETQLYFSRPSETLRGKAGNVVENQKSPRASLYELFLAVRDVPAAALGQAEAQSSA